jgi:hypothetical protein
MYKVEKWLQFQIYSPTGIVSLNFMLLVTHTIEVTFLSSEVLEERKFLSPSHYFEKLMPSCFSHGTQTGKFMKS